MFTGLIESVGTVQRMVRAGGGARLEIAATWPDGEVPRHGDSVAVNGACLTVLEPGPDGFVADVSPETLARTLLGAVRPGEGLNLERALRLGQRLGGHLVQGHVDAVVRLLEIRPEGAFARWRIGLPSEHAREVAPKGSVALHGVSLTVAALGADWFEVALIPETLRATVLDGLRPGASLHLETDMLAKYVLRALGPERTSALWEAFGGEGRGA